MFHQLARGYWPRRPDFDDVACGFGCGVCPRGVERAAFRSAGTPAAGFGFREKSGMLRSPLRFMNESSDV
jgi:hypothetical protein